MNWPTVELGELMARTRGSVDPGKFPEEVFDLYSVPAFDSRKPEVIAGRHIGSSKQFVETDDVLLSKIVPHIRRAWVVGEANGRRMIGSSEWIVFRNKHVYPPYLRNYLVSDTFHPKLQQTISGVGGSLLRARPASVAKLRVPLPPLLEQRRIAAILDKAEELRAKRRAALAVLDQLPQAIFLEMFGDLNLIEGRWGAKAFDETAVIDTRMTSDFETYADVYHIGIENIEKESGEIVSPKKVKESSLISGKYVFDERHLVYSKIRPNLNKVAMPNFEGLCSADAYPILPRAGICNREYLVMVLRSDFFLSYILGQSSRTNIPKVNKQQLLGFKVPLPPFDLQRRFAARFEAIHRAKANQYSALSKLDALFASLQHRAFAGIL